MDVFVMESDTENMMGMGSDDGDLSEEEE